MNKEDLDFLVEFFLLKDAKWRIEGELRRPTRDEIEIALDDMVRTVQESDESILIMIGNLLVKRTDDHIDVYVHAGDIPYYEQTN